jgi:hypothetical protein
VFELLLVADKRRSLRRYSSLTDWSPGVFFFFAFTRMSKKFKNTQRILQLFGPVSVEMATKVFRVLLNMTIQLRRVHRSRLCTCLYWLTAPPNRTQCSAKSSWGSQRKWNKQQASLPCRNVWVKYDKSNWRRERHAYSGGCWVGARASPLINFWGLPEPLEQKIIS